ncbi:hypothetical protein K438DRAFT_19315 [Mycena galopus ATCC 62051]|nr:hypothetical protein K438DRAFT_19315 [Mycena galopus ATCC 62051]
MSSRADIAWDRVLRLPPDMAELAAEFPGFTFDTSGYGDDTETKVTSLPPHMEARIPQLSKSTHESVMLPAIDFTQVKTPKLQPAPFVLQHRNSSTPFPAVEVDDMHKNAPHTPGPFAATRWTSLEELEAARKAIGNSSAEEKQQGKQKGKENGGTEDKLGKGKSFSGEDLIQLTRTVVDVNPWTASHGQKGHTTISAASAQHKAESLVGYKKVCPCFAFHLHLLIVDGIPTASTRTSQTSSERVLRRASPLVRFWRGSRPSTTRPRTSRKKARPN